MINIAYISNIIFIIWVFYEAFTITSFSEKDTIYMALFIIFSAINIIALSTRNNARDFLALFLERKKLEQEQKIQELKKGLNGDA